MFDIAPTELLLVAIVALLVIGPKDLPKAMRTVGQWVGRARGMARHFRSGIDTMIRESELEEMQKRWAEENARIMREHPATADMMEPLPPPAAQPALPDETNPAGPTGTADPYEPQLPLDHQPVADAPAPPAAEPRP